MPNSRISCKLQGFLQFCKLQKAMFFSALFIENPVIYSKSVIYLASAKFTLSVPANENAAFSGNFSWLVLPNPSANWYTEISRYINIYISVTPSRPSPSLPVSLACPAGSGSFLPAFLVPRHGGRGWVRFPGWWCSWGPRVSCGSAGSRRRCGFLWPSSVWPPAAGPFPLSSLARPPSSSPPLHPPPPPYTWSDFPHISR